MVDSSALFTQYLSLSLLFSYPIQRLPVFLSLLLHTLWLRFPFLPLSRLMVSSSPEQGKHVFSKEEESIQLYPFLTESIYLLFAFAAAMS